MCTSKDEQGQIRVGPLCFCEVPAYQCQVCGKCYGGVITHCTCEQPTPSEALRPRWEAYRQFVQGEP